MITIICFFLKLVFLAFGAYSFTKLVEEREFYNDVIDTVAAKKYHSLPQIKSWTELEFGVPRILMELLFVLLVVLPTFFSWQLIAVPIYLVALVVIYKRTPARNLNRNEVMAVTLARIVFILLTFIF